MEAPMATAGEIVGGIGALLVIIILIGLCCYCVIRNTQQQPVQVVQPFGGQFPQQMQPYPQPGQQYQQPGQQQYQQYAPPGQQQFQQYEQNPQYSQPPPQYTPSRAPIASNPAPARPTTPGVP